MEYRVYFYCPTKPQFDGFLYSVFQSLSVMFSSHNHEKKWLVSHGNKKLTRFSLLKCQIVFFKNNAYASHDRLFTMNEWPSWFLNENQASHGYF